MASGQSNSTERAVDLMECYCSGRGVQPRGVRVGDKADFKVHTEGTGPGNCKAQVIGPGDINILCHMKKTEQNLFKCVYIPRQPGNYIINITVAGQHIPKSPFWVQVGAFKESRILTYGPGLTDGVVGFPAIFTVETYGETCDLDGSIQGPSNAKFDYKDNGDGSADITYWPTASGEYAILLRCNDEDIPKSPYMAQIVERSNFDPTKVVASGPGLEKEGNVVNQSAEFTVDAGAGGEALLNIICLDVDLNPLKVEVKDNHDGTYFCHYLPCRNVKHMVTVTWGSVSIQNSPFRVFVSEASNPTKVRVYGPALEQPVEAFTPTYLVVNCSQAGRGNVSLTLADEDGTDVPVQIVEIKDNIVRINFEPKTAGPYLCSISFADKEVPGSPYTIKVLSSSDIVKVRVKEEGPEDEASTQKTLGKYETEEENENGKCLKMIPFLQDANENDIPASDITDLQLKTVADLIGSRWQDLGIKLGLSYNELQNLATPVTGGPTQYAARMLNEWHDEHADMNTYRVREAVVKALKKSGRADVAFHVNSKLRTANDIQKVFQDISRNLTNDWRNVGLYLQISSDKLDTVKASPGLNGDPRLQMLNMWQQRTVSLDQHNQLVTALKELGLQNVIIAIEECEEKTMSKTLTKTVPASSPCSCLSHNNRRADTPGEKTVLKTVDQASHDQCWGTKVEQKSESLGFLHEDFIKAHTFLTEEVQQELQASGQLDLYDKYPVLTDEDFQPMLGMGIPYENYILNQKKLIDQRFGEVTSAGLDSGEFTCVIIGKMGTGKSSLGNLLLGKDEFRVSNSATSVTHLLQSKDVKVGDVKVKVFDSPGLRDMDDVGKHFELRKLLEFANEGIDCFIITMNMATSRIDAEDLAAFENIEELYGKEVYKHAILVFTHGKEVESKHSLQKYLDGVTQEKIREVFDLVQDRIITIENKPHTKYEHRLYREKLLQEILRAIKTKRGGKYTNTLFEEIKRNQEEQKKEKRGREEQMLKLRSIVNLNVIQLVHAELKEKEKYEEVSVIMKDENARKDFIDKIYNRLVTDVTSRHDVQKYLREFADEVRHTIENNIHRAGDLALEYILERDVDEYATKTFRRLGDLDKTSYLLSNQFKNHQHKLSEDWLYRALNSLKQKLQERKDVEKQETLMRNMTDFLKKNVHVCKWEESRILNAFREKFLCEEHKDNLSDYLTKCLSSGEVKCAIWQKEDADIAKAKLKALSKVEDCFSEELRSFISTRPYLRLVEHNNQRYKKHIERFVAFVKPKMPIELARCLSENDIKQRITECLDSTIGNIMNASFLDKLAIQISAWLKLSNSRVHRYLSDDKSGTN